MGKVLRREHLAFFTERMDEHNRVLTCEMIPDRYEYLFRVKRTLRGRESDVIVHLTDAYQYSFSEFYNRPDQLRSSSFVVLGLPHGSADSDVIEEAKEHCIGVGHIGKFMGALTRRDLWEYESPEERQLKREAQRRRNSRRQRR